jgi:DNA-binding CsgD family transcriptional regulator
MKILIALGNLLLCEALKRLLIISNCKYPIEVLCTSNGNGHDVWMEYKIIVTDHSSLSKIPKGCFGSSMILVIDSGLPKETILSMFLTANIHGIIPAEANIDILLMAINAASNGEVWIDNTMVKSLLNSGISRRVKNIPRLTEREIEILELIRKGYRNKEIAHALYISEQTVKSHLNRIFRKMNVSGRMELVIKFANSINLLDNAEGWA